MTIVDSPVWLSPTLLSAEAIEFNIGTVFSKRSARNCLEMRYSQENSWFSIFFLFPLPSSA
jgi:hypothetical protein